MKFYHSDYFLVAYTKTHTYRWQDRFIVGPTWKHNSEKSFDVRGRVKTPEVDYILFKDPVRTKLYLSSLVVSFPDHTRVRDLLRAGKPIEFCWWQINPQGTIALSSPPPSPPPQHRTHLFDTPPHSLFGRVYILILEREGIPWAETPLVWEINSNADVWVVLSSSSEVLYDRL